MDINKDNLVNIDINTDIDILENIDIDMYFLENIDINYQYQSWNFEKKLILIKYCID